jgi:hypothetical protein
MAVVYAFWPGTPQTAADRLNSSAACATHPACKCSEEVALCCVAVECMVFTALAQW